MHFFLLHVHASNLKLSKRHTFNRNLLLLSSYMCRYNFTLTMQWYLPLTRHTKLDWDRHVDELPRHFCLLIRNRLFKLCLSVICSVNICLSFPKHYEDDLWCNPWIQIVFLFKWWFLLATFYLLSSVNNSCILTIHTGIIPFKCQFWNAQTKLQVFAIFNKNLISTTDNWWEWDPN